MKKNITSKTPQQVHIIARVAFKQSGYIAYKVRPSQGGDPYTVTVSPAGEVKSCDCPAHKPCKHMVACQAAEDARRGDSSSREVKEEKLERRHVAPLHSAREFSLMAR